MAQLTTCPTGGEQVTGFKTISGHAGGATRFKTVLVPCGHTVDHTQQSYQGQTAITYPGQPASDSVAVSTF